jgi:segregation and condensation protein B
LSELDIENLLEALLFVADNPVTLHDLARGLDCELDLVTQALEELTERCANRGVRIVRSGPRVQMVSAPEAATHVERFLGVGTSGKLSSAALETLAIIAYRQPLTRAQVEAVRGVNSDSVLRTLTAKGLVEQVGRLDQAGRPLLYGTTFEFLQYFGIKSLKDLPSLPELEDYSLEEIEKAANQEEE